MLCRFEKDRNQNIEMKDLNQNIEKDDKKIIKSNSKIN